MCQGVRFKAVQMTSQTQRCDCIHEESEPNHKRSFEIYSDLF